MISGDGNSEWQPVEPPEPFTGAQDNKQPERQENRPRRPQRPLDPINNPEDKREIDDLKKKMQAITDTIRTRVGDGLVSVLPNVPHTSLFAGKNITSIEAQMPEGANTGEGMNDIDLSETNEGFNVQVPYITDRELSEKVIALKEDPNKQIDGVLTDYRIEGDNITKSVWIPLEIQDSRAILNGPKNVVRSIVLTPTVEDIEHIGGALMQLQQRIDQSDQSTNI